MNCIIREGFAWREKVRGYKIVIEGERERERVTEWEREAGWGRDNANERKSGGEWGREDEKEWGNRAEEYGPDKKESSMPHVSEKQQIKRTQGLFPWKHLPREMTNAAHCRSDKPSANQSDVICLDLWVIDLAVKLVCNHRTSPWSRCIF